MNTPESPAFSGVFAFHSERWWDVLLLCGFGGLGGFFGFGGFPGLPFFAAALSGFSSGRDFLDVGFVEGPLVGDLLGLVLRAGAAPDGHHDAPAGGRGGVQIDGLWWWIGQWRVGDRAGEQDSAFGHADVGVPGRCGPHDGPVGLLTVLPPVGAAVERFQ